MEFYGFAKDILVPGLAPLVAAFSLIVTFYFDRRRTRAQQENEIENAARAIYRDSLLLREQYQMIGYTRRSEEEIDNERYVVTESASKRIFKNLYNNPDIYNRYLDGFHIKIEKNMINYEKLPLIVSELEFRLEKIRRTTHPDFFIMFGYEFFIYAGAESTESRKECTEALREISKTRPEIFENLFNPDSSQTAKWLREEGRKR